MSYYDDSSLFVAPNGYKTSVLFAQKPMDANGQLAFTRSNDTATRVGPDGLIEKVRTNLLLQSNTFNTTWTTSSSTITGGQAGYDGTNNAWELNSSTSGGSILQSNTQAGLQTFSVYAKGSVSTGIRLYAFGSVNVFAFFNLNTGAVGSVSAGATAQIQSVGSGWYRCSMSFDQTNTIVRFYTTNNANANAAGIVYIQNSQLELSDFGATDYIPTTSTAVSVGPVANLPRLNYPINSDGSVGCPSLLLEPQTTALNQFSESFDNAYWQLKTDVTIEANTTDTLDPAGYYGAEKITETATTARHRLASNGTTSSTVNHTASVFMKKGTARYGFVTYAAGTIYTIIVDLEDGTITQTSTSGTIVAQKVEDYGNGWYRISVTGLSGISGSTQYALQFGSAGSAVPSSYVSNIPSFTGSTSNYLYAWGANLTATSYLQSYVPTLGAASTRGADACSKTGISSLIGQPEGTIFVEVNDFSYNPQAVLFKITGLISVQTRTTNQIRIEGTGYDYFYTPTQKHLKIAAAYTASTIVIYVNGVQVHEDTSVTISGGSNLIFNETGNGTEILNQALLFKTRLSNSELASLTTL